jgi:hypothetical protein
VRATLATLYAYLSWVPLAYVFESNLVEALLKLFPQPPFRNVALQCLSEARAPARRAGAGSAPGQSAVVLSAGQTHRQ